MKSQLFNHKCCGGDRFHHKTYNRMIHSEIHDDIMESLDKESNSLEFLKKDTPILYHPPQAQTSQQPDQKVSLSTPKKKVRSSMSQFEAFLIRFVDEVGTAIFDFITFRDISNLRSISRTIDGLLSPVVREIRCKNSFQAAHQNGLLNNLTHINDIMQSYRYDLSAKPMLSTQKMFKDSTNIEVAMLTRDIVDFIVIKEAKIQKYLQSVTSMKMDNELFLSLIKDLNEVTVWALKGINSGYTVFTIKKLRFGKNCTIVSADFCGNQYLIVQTQEEEEDEEEDQEAQSFIRRIYITDIKLKLMNSNESEDSNQGVSHYFEVKYKKSSDDTALKLLHADEREVEFIGLPPSSGFETCLQNRERLFFYITEQGIIIPYNLKTKRLEKVYISDSICSLTQLIIPRQRYSPITFLGYMIDKESNISYFEYNKKSCEFSVNELRYYEDTNMENQAKTTFQKTKSLYGSFVEKNSSLVNYIIVERKSKFHFINLDTRESREMDIQQSLDQINNWSVFQEFLIIAYKAYYLCVYKFNSTGATVELVNKQHPPLTKIDWNSEVFLEVNASYLIVIESISHISSRVLVTSFPELILQNSAAYYLKFSHHSIKWDVELSPEFEPPKYEPSKHTRPENTTRFKFNKLIVKVGTQNVYINFESSLSFIDYKRVAVEPEPKPKPNKNKTILNRNDITISYPEILRYKLALDKTITDKNKEKKKSPLDFDSQQNRQKFEEYKQSYNNAYLFEHIPGYERPPKYGYGFPDQGKSDESEDDVNEAVSGRKRRILRKKTYRKVLDKLFKFGKYDNPLKEEFRLTSLHADNQKEWFLRKLDRRKTNVKSTYCWRTNDYCN